MGSGGWSPTDMHWCCSFHVAADTSDFVPILVLGYFGSGFFGLSASVMPILSMCLP